MNSTISSLNSITGNFDRTFFLVFFQLTVTVKLTCVIKSIIIV